MFFFFIVGMIVFVCFILLIYCSYKFQPFHTKNNELKPSMIHLDKNNENNENNVYKYQNDKENKFPQIFENNTKSKMQRMQTESSCMDIYLNDNCHHCNSFNNNFNDIELEKEKEEKEINEQADKEYKYIAEKERSLKDDISNISNHPSPSYQGKELISSVYDIHDKCKINDFTDQGMENNNVMEHFQNNSFQPFKKEFVKSKNEFQFNAENFKVYLINMKNSVERLHRFIHAYNASDLSFAEFERVEGVNGKQLDIKKYVSASAYKSIINAEKKGYRKYHYELTRGAIGCYLSHVEVYKRVKEQKEDFALIFEDDVRLYSLNILEKINKVINTVPKNWDILLLGCVCFVCGKFSTFYDVNRYFLMHGYIIKKSSAKKILHLIEGKPIEQQIDAHFSELVDRGLLKIYCLRDNLAVQWDMGTNIQMPVKNIKGVNPFRSLMD